MSTQKRILLVGKDKFLFPLYARSFKEAGFVVQLASSPEAALERTGETLPHLVLYDFDEERKGKGTGFLKKIQEDQNYGDAPIICLSNEWESAGRTRALRAGAHAYFVKAQVMPGELVEHAHRLLA